jgi:hypothetical protein
MSDVIVSTNDPITTVTTTDNLVEIAITNNPVEVSASTAGVQGVPGVVAADAPITYNSGTQTVGINQSALVLAQSQITNLVSDLAGKANLAGGNALTGAQTITSTAIGQVPLTLVGASGQTANLLSTAGGARIPAAGNYFIAPGITSTFVADFNAGSTTTTPVTIAGLSGQTANLLRLAVAGSDVAVFTPTGTFRTAGLITAGDITNVLGQLSVYTTVASRIGAVIRGAASQSADLLQLQNSAGTILVRADQFGGVFAGYAAFTSDSPTLLPLRVRGAANQLEDLTEWQNSSATVLGGVNANSQIFTGSTSPIQTAVGAGINGVTGNGTTVTFSTTNAHGLANGDRVTIAGLTPAGYNGTYIISGVSTFSFNIANTTTGTATGSGTVSVDAQTSITSRSAGTISLQVRGATSQAADLLRFVNAGGTTLSWFNAGGSLFMGGSGTLISAVSGRAAFITNDATQVPMLVKGASGQTANLFEVQTFASTLVSITSAGNLNATGQVRVGTSSGLAQLSVVSAGASTIGAVIRAAASQTANLVEFQESNTGVPSAITAFGGFRVRNFGASVSDTSLAVFAGYATEKPIVIRGAASQTANLLELQNSGATIQSYFDSFGNGHIAQAPSGSSFGLYVGTNANPAVGGIMVRGTTSQTGDLFQAQDVGGFVKASISAGGSLLADRAALGGAVYATGIYYGKLNVLQEPGGNVAAFQGRDSQSVDLLRLRQGASSTGDFITMQNSSGTNLARITSGGDIFGNRVRTLNSAFRGQEANGGGQVFLERNTSLPSNPGANIGLIYFRDGTNAGTLKLVVRAGAAGAETTILDNIPQ